MNKNMETKNSQSLALFQTDIKNLGDTVNKNLESYTNDINNNIDEVNNSVKNNFNTINKSVGDGFGDLKTYIDTTKTEINTKLDSVFQRVSNGKNKLVSTLLTFGISVNEGTTFNDIDEGIKKLGNLKLAAEGKLEIAEHSVTPEKIIAGQSVTINDKEIAGTATSDATASADHILSGQTAYVNGQFVIGTMANHGQKSVTLSKNNRNQVLEAGYYDSITITSNLPDIPATIIYTHHVHSTENTSHTVTDESFSSGKAYGSETSKTSGGCYTEAIYGPCNGSGVATKEDYGGFYVDTDGDGNLNQNVFYVGSCDICGGLIEADKIGDVGPCNNQRVIGYKTTCGRVSGQVIHAEVTY